MANKYKHWLEQLNALDMDLEIYNRLFTEIKRLNENESRDSEAMENYYDFVLNLPWGGGVRKKVDVEQAKIDFDGMIYGHERIKKQLLDQIALENHLGRSVGKVMLLNGPSGTGKTHIAQCYAKVAGKLFYPMRLGGLQDATSILGTFRGYKNARSSYLMDFIAKHRTKNIVVLLDEIDKLDSKNVAVQHALLQLTDRTTGFVDYYVDIPFDISGITFIATSNDITQISPALIDRLNCFEVPEFKAEELQKIMKDHLIPKKLSEYQLDQSRFRFDEDALQMMYRWTELKSVRKINLNIEALFAHAIRKYHESGEAVINQCTVKEAFGYDAYKMKVESFENVH